MLVVESEVVVSEDEVEQSFKCCNGGRDMWKGSVDSAWRAAWIPSLLGMLVHAEGSDVYYDQDSVGW